MPAVRHLAAILAADVAGYSRLMGADEEGTHERVRAHLGQVIEPKIREHRGRAVKSTGDGLLAEFPSVVDAVRCAVDVQEEMAAREPEVPEDRRIEFRIGINLGDIIIEADDIFGDGVNVAARLEALAEPGGICVSGTVREHIGERLPYAFEDMGAQSVKNIARPVRVYALRPEGLAASTRVSVAPATTGSPLVAPRLSIVVLPFANLSNDPEQEYFADAITEDVTTDLSRIDGMFVIARGTAFTFKGKAADAKRVGRELGVRYVLEGSVRKLGPRIRVNAQLIGAETAAHLWAERFDGDTSDLFALQDEITSRIAVALGVELIAAEAVRPGEHPDALDYILRGRAILLNLAKPDAYNEAVNLLAHALALAPQSVEAQSWLAAALVARVHNGMTATATSDLARADALISQALAVSPRSARVHFVKGNLLRAQGRYAEAIPEFETALALNRNLLPALNGLAWSKLSGGSIEEATAIWERAIGLSPRDPVIGHLCAAIGFGHLLQSRNDDAILWLERARGANEILPFVYAWLASAYAQRGETDRAAIELAEARRLSPDDRYSSLARLAAVGNYQAFVPKIRTLCDATYIAGLRKAGMPEESGHR